MRKHAALIFVLSILWARVATAQAIERFFVPVDYQGGQIQLKAELQKPTGSGPFPVVIALHACGGYNDPVSTMTTWLPLLWQLGYATLRIDSFTARGDDAGVCWNTGEVTGVERATDALAAAYVLARRPDVGRDRIAVIGWSHGGGGASRATQDGPNTLPWRKRLASRGGKLVASIDLYGGCGTTAYPVVVPLLVLVGAADHWVLAPNCLELAKANPTLVTVQVYPGSPMASTAHLNPITPRAILSATMRRRRRTPAFARRNSCAGICSEYEQQQAVSPLVAGACPAR